MATTATPPRTTPRTQIRRLARPASYRSDTQWREHGLKTQRRAAFGALIAAWTGLPFALWIAFVGTFFGAVAGIFGLSIAGSFAGQLVNNLGASLLSMFLGACLGLIAGFLLIYYYLFTNPTQLLGALVTGVIVSWLVFRLMLATEPLRLRMRGYREPSRRERALLDPLLIDAGQRLGLTVVPALWISEAQKPGAWAHMRAIVLTKGLLGDYSASESPPKPELDPLAISAVLAHELTHWRKGDPVGLAMVSACFYPFVLIVNGVQWVRIRSEVVGILAWCLLWPVWVTSRFVVVPLMANRSRAAEHEADAAAAGLGDEYRLGLRRALDELSAWERPRSGWEDVLAATHPPIEERLERLEAPREQIQPGREQQPASEPELVAPPVVKPARPTRAKAPPSEPSRRSTTVAVQPPPIEAQPKSDRDDGSPLVPAQAAAPLRAKTRAQLQRDSEAVFEAIGRLIAQPDQDHFGRILEDPADLNLNVLSDLHTKRQATPRSAKETRARYERWIAEYERAVVRQQSMDP